MSIDDPDFATPQSDPVGDFADDLVGGGSVGFDFTAETEFDAALEAAFDDDADALPRRRHLVTAVVVSHNGATWLPAVMTTLAGQTIPPSAVVGVDTGSTDASANRLRESLGGDRVVILPEDAGFGAAVAAGLRHVRIPPAEPDVVEWVWLLHDDSAPDPGCLEALLNVADDNPGVAILGPKVLGWHDRRLLLEVGVSISSSGRRHTGLERREHDQGQHDAIRDVLAVGSAGMLVRRDVWDRLEGFDPQLPLFRDDIDFCWRAHRSGERVLVAPPAIMHHREASSHDRRDRPAAVPRPHAADRQAAIHVLLAQTRSWALIPNTIRLAFISLYRTIVFLLGKDVAAARDELIAWWRVIIHPGQMRASRSLIARTATESSSAVRHLRPRPGSQVRYAFEVLAGVLTTSEARGGTSISALESGPIDESAAFLDEGSTGLWKRILSHPAVILTVALLVVGFVALRSAWFAVGTLAGGALLPVPEGAGDLWGTYVDAFHNVGPGSATPSPPYLAFLAVVATILFGKASWAVTVALLLAVPLAGLSAFFAVRGLLKSTVIRVWVAVAYALLPAVTAAVDTGRVGTAVSAVVLPIAARLLVRTLRGGTIRTAAAAAIAVSILAAFTPLLWVIGVIVVVVVVWTRFKSRNVILRAAIAVLAPIIMLLPWSGYVLTHPSLLLFEPGLQIPVSTSPIDVVLLHPGGPSMTPWWVTIGIVIGGFVALLRRDTWPITVPLFAIAGVALIFGVIQSIVRVAPPSSGEPISPWPGPATLVIGAAFILAGALATDGLTDRLAGSSFSVAQPIAAVVGALAVLAPIVSAGFWVTGSSVLINRDERSAVPAFVAADAEGPAKPRTLMLTVDQGVIKYALINGVGPRMGDSELEPNADVWDRFDPIVSDLTSGRGGDEVEQLANYAVRFIVLDRGNRNSNIAGLLDSQPGLRRVANADGEALWRVSGVTARARVVAEDGGTVVVPAEAGVEPLVSAGIEAEGTRELILSQQFDANWRASLDGTDLVAVTPPADSPNSWATVFSVPDAAGTLVVDYNSRARDIVLWIQLIVVIFIIVLALPNRRTVDPDPDSDQDDVMEAVNDDRLPV